MLVLLARYLSPATASAISKISTSVNRGLHVGGGRGGHGFAKTNELAMKRNCNLNVLSMYMYLNVLSNSHVAEHPPPPPPTHMVYEH